MGGSGGLNLLDFQPADMSMFCGVNVQNLHSSQVSGIEGGAREGHEIDGRSEQGADIRAPEHNQYAEEDEAPWYLGKAKDDFRRRRQSSQNQEDDDPIQVCSLFLIMIDIG